MKAAPSARWGWGVAGWAMWLGVGGDGGVAWWAVGISVSFWGMAQLAGGACLRTHAHTHARTPTHIHYTHITHTLLHALKYIHKQLNNKYTVNNEHIFYDRNKSRLLSSVFGMGCFGTAAEHSLCVTGQLNTPSVRKKRATLPCPARPALRPCAFPTRFIRLAFHRASHTRWCARCCASWSCRTCSAPRGGAAPSARSCSTSAARSR